ETLPCLLISVPPDERLQITALAKASMLDALRLSVGTLTIVPAGAIAEIDRRTAARAMIIAPLAVLPLAITVALVGWLGRFAGLPPFAVGLLVVGGLSLGT